MTAKWKAKVLSLPRPQGDTRVFLSAWESPSWVKAELLTQLQGTQLILGQFGLWGGAGDSLSMKTFLETFEDIQPKTSPEDNKWKM